LSKEPRAQSARLRVLWAPRALRDLERIGGFISRDKPIAAVEWVRDLIELGESVIEMPLSGRRVPELARDDVREQFKDGYRLIYQLMNDHVRILAVFESHRRFPLSAKSIR
jgi:toxin ParE1/3/4